MLTFDRNCLRWVKGRFTLESRIIESSTATPVGLRVSNSLENRLLIRPHLPQGRNAKNKVRG